jgi:hypothetical protein
MGVAPGPKRVSAQIFEFPGRFSALGAGRCQAEAAEPGKRGLSTDSNIRRLIEQVLFTALGERIELPDYGFGEKECPPPQGLQRAVFHPLRKENWDRAL